LSPAQTIFPFNTFPLDTTSDQNTPMSPHDYRSPSTYSHAQMNPNASNVTSGDSFALQMSPPQVSDIPADYSGFEAYEMEYNQNRPSHDTNTASRAYANGDQNHGSYQTYESGNSFIYSQPYDSAPHQQVAEHTSSSDNGMYLDSQFPINNQGPLEGYIDLGSHVFSGNSDCYSGHPVAPYQ